MTQLAFDLPGLELGVRSERVEFGVRFLVDHFDRREGAVEACSEYKARWLTAASTADELPYHGYPRGGVELVTRLVVTYTGQWTTPEQVSS